MRYLLLFLLLAACGEGEGEPAPPAELAGIPVEAALPQPLPEPTRMVLAAGAQAYRVHCAVCHGTEGRGDGPLIARGFTQPAPFAAALPPARTVQVIEEGYGAMRSQAASVLFEERWAIAYHVERLGE